MNRLERANAVVEEILNSAKLTDAEFEEVMEIVLRKGKEIARNICRDNGKYNIFIVINQSEISFPVTKLNGFVYGDIHALTDAWEYRQNITLVVKK